jgi:hypothetical protein
MADTVITPAGASSDSGANAAGWAVAVIVILGVILFGLFVWPGIGSVTPSTTNTNPNVDVNVRLPQNEQVTPAAGSVPTPTNPAPTTPAPTQ